MREPQRILRLFQEIGYLMHIDRQKGFLHMAETADLGRFEEKLRPMMSRVLEVLKGGPTDEKARILLDIHKIAYWRDPAYDSDDLQLLQIGLEAGLLLRRSDWDDLRLFAADLLMEEGRADDVHRLGSFLRVLRQAASELRLLSREEADRELERIARSPVANGLSREEVDRLLAENFPREGQR